MDNTATTLHPTNEFILGVPVSTQNEDELLAGINKDIQAHKKNFIVAINPEKVLKARKDPSLMELLKKATVHIPDGIGLIYASKLKRGAIRTRVTGIDCMDKLCELAATEGYPVFLYGAKPGTAQKAADTLCEKYSSLVVAGCADGYVKDDDVLVEQIQASGAKMLFVAMGSPRQEEWIISHMPRLNVLVYQGVGGSFDVYAGTLKRAPEWMQKSGLEWLYRLYKEPWRITRQIKLLWFVVLVILD